MMKLLVAILFSSFLFSQQRKIKIVDENDKILNNAKIFADDKILYANDDGFVLIDGSVKSVLVSAPEYEEIKITMPVSIIKLNPIYKNIDEVQIKSIDVSGIFKNVLKDYLSIYDSKTTVYDALIKQKAYLDGNISNLLIAHLNIWSKNNVYNFGNKKVDDFLQINLNNIDYYKTLKDNNDYPFNDVQPIPRDFTGKMFLNSELSGVFQDVKEKRILGKIVYENKDLQKIKFNLNVEKANCEGIFLLSKADNAIVYFEIGGKINSGNSSIKTNKFGKTYTTITDSFGISYDFYKKDGKYFMAKNMLWGSGRNVMDEKEHPIKFQQEIIFQSNKEGKSNGLKSKIDLSKILTDNISTKEIQESTTLLSKEEQDFVGKP